MQPYAGECAYAAGIIGAKVRRQRRQNRQRVPERLAASARAGQAEGRRDRGSREAFVVRRQTPFVSGQGMIRAARSQCIGASGDAFSTWRCRCRAARSGRRSVPAGSVEQIICPSRFDTKHPIVGHQGGEGSPCRRAAAMHVKASMDLPPARTAANREQAGLGADDDRRRVDVDRCARASLVTADRGQRRA